MHINDTKLVNKNSFLPAKMRIQIAFIALLGILVGFFLSRAMLSIAMILLGVNALIGVHPKYWVKQKWWWLGLIWVLFYFLSGFWSTDLDYWHTRCETKLPILLLPLAFAFTPAFSIRPKTVFWYVLNLLLMIAIGYSTFCFFSNAAFYIKGYNYSHVVPTLPKNDYIIFSITLAASLVWNIYIHPHLVRLWQKRINVALVVLIIIVLHLLAVRTGLMCFYLFLVGWSGYLLWRKKTRNYGLLVVIIGLLMLTTAWKFVPTLHNRIEHTLFSWVMFQEKNMSGDYSDIGRYMSYDIAVRLIKKHPFLGVGAGEMLDSMKGGYTQWYPQIPDAQRLIPHNQFLSVALACGIPAMLFFIAWVIFPLIEVLQNREGFFFVILWLMMLIPLMVEPLLETQFGVFVFLFFLLWQRHTMLHSKPSTAQPPHQIP